MISNGSEEEGDGDKDRDDRDFGDSEDDEDRGSNKKQKNGGYRYAIIPTFLSDFVEISGILRAYIPLLKR